MTDSTRHKLGMAAGAAITTAAGAIGGPIGIVVGIFGAAVLGWNGYKVEPPREVWSDEKRQAERAKRSGETVQEYDDESPVDPRRK